MKINFLINFLLVCYFSIVKTERNFQKDENITLATTIIVEGNNKTLSQPIVLESIYYDYDEPQTNEDKDSVVTTSLDIYPDPEKVYSNLKEIELDDYSKREDLSNFPESLDKDLKGRDFIDNIMYIYYGGHGVLRKGIGGSVIVIGAVFGLAAQILTITLSLLKNRRHRRSNSFFPIVLNLLVMLCISNFVFIVGVQASKNILKCEMTAILLHFLHLSTAVWSLVYVYTIFDYIQNETGPNVKIGYLVAYGAPAVYVMLSFAISGDNYEVRNYCWMSVQHGMIFYYMVPVSILIIVSTILGTICLRKIISKQRQVIGESIESIMECSSKCDYIPPIIQTDKFCEEAEKIYEEEYKSKLELYDSKFSLAALSLADLSIQSSSEVQDFADFKRAVRFSLFFQPTFGICWFLGVVALEYSQSCVMPAVFIVCYNIMNWCLLVRSSIICPMIPLSSENSSLNTNDLDSQKLNNNCSEETNNQTPCQDTIPLLCSSSSVLSNNTTNTSDQNSNQKNWETTILENSITTVNVDCISTISS